MTGEKILCQQLPHHPRTFMSNDSRPNINISGGNFKDFMAGNKQIKTERDYIDTQNNYYGDAPEAAELAKELDELLQSLKTIHRFC